MDQAVALIPGFLGFDHLGDRTYFADWFVGALGASLLARGVRAKVVTLSTLPFGSLRDRQGELAAELGRVEAKIGPRRWHLVGHSTGGLDAALFAGTRGLGFAAETGSFFEGDPPKCDVATVTTLAAPLYGTALALAPIATLLDHPSVDGAVAAAKALFDAGQQDARSSRLSFVWSALRTGSHLWPIRLANELRPDIAGRLTRENELRAGITLRSIATIAPRPDGPDGDHLFLDLWTWTHDGARGAAAAPAFTRPARVIASAGAVVPPDVDAGDSDGVVSTVRQAVDGRPVALVVADHGDVIGRYRRPDPLDDEPIDDGLLTSRASFGDAEFFELVGSIADGIAAR